MLKTVTAPSRMLCRSTLGRGPPTTEGGANVRPSRWPVRLADGRHDLRADCGCCAGLCCVAPAFAASADFAMDKPAAQPCPNLLAGFRCGMHDSLPRTGLSRLRRVRLLRRWSAGHSGDLRPMRLATRPCPGTDRTPYRCWARRARLSSTPPRSGSRSVCCWRGHAGRRPTRNEPRREHLSHSTPARRGQGTQRRRSPRHSPVLRTGPLRSRPPTKTAPGYDAAAGSISRAGGGVAPARGRSAQSHD